MEGGTNTFQVLSVIKDFNPALFCFELFLLFGIYSLGNCTPLPSSLPGKIIFIMHECMLSHFSRVWLFAVPWGSPPGFSVHGDSPGKNTGVGCHALLQGNLSDPGIEPASLMSPALAGGFFCFVLFFTTEPPGKPHVHCSPPQTFPGSSQSFFFLWAFTALC